MSDVRKRHEAALKERRDRRMAEMFGSHVAEFREYTSTDGQKVEELVWKRPGSSNYAVWYRSVGGNLFVTGDLYDAIYVREFGLRWWSQCDLSYFASKCMASPEGRGFKSWDPDYARQNIRRLVAEFGEGARKKFREADGWDSLESSEAWYAWLGDRGYEVFSDAYYDFGDIGTTVDWLCEAQLYGLKLAFAQVDEKAAAA